MFIIWNCDLIHEEFSCRIVQLSLNYYCHWKSFDFLLSKELIIPYIYLNPRKQESVQRKALVATQVLTFSSVNINFPVLNRPQKYEKTCNQERHPIINEKITASFKKNIHVRMSVWQMFMYSASLAILTDQTLWLWFEFPTNDKACLIHVYFITK